MLRPSTFCSLFCLYLDIVATKSTQGLVQAARFVRGLRMQPMNDTLKRSLLDEQQCISQQAVAEFASLGYVPEMVATSFNH